MTDDPATFFEHTLRARFETLHEHVAGRTSIGSLLFRVLGSGEWSLRLRDGELEVQRGIEDDTVLQVSLAAEDFEMLVVESLRAADRTGSLSRPGAFRALELDAETARLIRRVRGNLLFAVIDGERERRLLLTPGLGQPDFENPDCRLECRAADFVDAQHGKVTPMQLFSQGKLKITGNLQLALALGGLFQ